MSQSPRRHFLSASAFLGGVLLPQGLSPLFSNSESVFEEAQAADASGPIPIAAAQERMDKVYRAKTTIGRIEMTIVKPGRTRTMRMKIWTSGQEKSLIVLESPARDTGTATLKVDKNLWNYLPKISRTVRIPPSMMLGSWMGSDFTNDDLVKDASYANDFNASWAGPSTSPAGWIMRMTAKEGKVGLWKKIEMSVNEDATLPTQARYYDRRDRLARTMFFEDVKTLGGRKVPSVMRIVPSDKQDEYTQMKYIDMQFDAEVPASTFSLSRLKRGR
ncbi:MAG: outer membrane lipoprotein-sorting protein [Polyangiaceae bacterium]|nr:outer membrane lipoprotein-sorting protein [Polyangiaceae bacterium]